ncbi:MAG: aldehyde dehydrogenase family protein [Candidatus Thermoplasmatota archaeon]|nr:aldehyde dehydrogenase family protein [Candidatus Thermoplasmatota archaeon]|tara:strand:+ start:5043 stop:6461 length:1419 start_codon:yes stop_codon:yes gene_type:complete
MQTREHLYINGSWVESTGEGSIEVINPANEETIGSVPVGSAADVEAAVAAAKAAFPDWSKTSVEDRIGYLNMLSQAIKGRTEELTELITSEVGTPINYCRGAMVGTPRVVSRSYAKILENFDWEEEVRNSLIVKEPIGVVGMITPWNYPLHQIIGKVAPAIAAGCTMVVKPSKEAPLNSFILADIIHEIGLPAGVFNLVSGHGREIGEVLSSHPDVDMVSFTGSTGAGVRVSELAAPSVKRVTLELGGKSANIILEDAEIAKAASASIHACFGNSGQECSALTRLLVPESKKQEIVDVISAKMEKYSVGDPMDESKRCGPMVSRKQQESVSSYIAAGIEEGATLVVGGLGMPEGLDKGYFVQPTVFADVTPEMAIFREEIFGPVLSITTYSTEEEAIELANDSEYGLSGGVWSGDEDRAMRVAREMRTGQVSINGGPFNISAPFGGYKLSGNGRELGVQGLEEFLEIKAIQR